MNFFFNQKKMEDMYPVLLSKKIYTMLNVSIYPIGVKKIDLPEIIAIEEKITFKKCSFGVIISGCYALYEINNIPIFIILPLENTDKFFDILLQTKKNIYITEENSSCKIFINNYHIYYKVCTSNLMFGTKITINTDIYEYVHYGKVADRIYELILNGIYHYGLISVLNSYITNPFMKATLNEKKIKYDYVSEIKYLKKNLDYQSKKDKKNFSDIKMIVG